MNCHAYNTYKRNKLHCSTNCETILDFIFQTAESKDNKDWYHVQHPSLDHELLQQMTSSKQVTLYKLINVRYSIK